MSIVSKPVVGGVSVWICSTDSDAITRTAVLAHTRGSYGHSEPHGPVTSAADVLGRDKNKAGME